MGRTKGGIRSSCPPAISPARLPARPSVASYRADEALGRTLDLIIPERLRERHWSGYRESMATGTTRYGRGVLAVPAVRKDGTSISVEFTIALLHDADGTLLGPAAIIRDVTARWE
jgi:PAS domain S-box-containing protein